MALLEGSYLTKLMFVCVTGHGARLRTLHGSVVGVSFHGSQHAEATIESADASSCLLLEQCMQNTTAALGISMQRSSCSHDDIAALSKAIAAFSREVEACMSYVDNDCRTVDGNDKIILAQIRNCTIDTDTCCSRSSML